MVTFLLVVIYVAFIGLGIPDSIFGSAWPAIYTELNIPVSYASYVNVVISVGTVVTSVFSAKIINKFGTGIVTAVSTLLTAVALLGFSFAKSIVCFFVMAIPLGIGAGAIDSALNNYVALHYKASHMNFLHCFYGIGVSASPFLMSFALSVNENWRDGYIFAVIIQFVICVLCFIALPFWHRGEKNLNEGLNIEKDKNGNLANVLKMPSVYVVTLILVGSVGLEFCCGNWCTTYLVEGRGLKPDFSSFILTFYYLGIALGRFCSGILANKLTSWKIIRIGHAVTFVALILIILPLPIEFSIVGLFLIGFGNGPVFPNIAHLTPRNFGVENSQTVMGLQMAASYIGVTVMPFIFGQIAENVSVNFFGYFLLIMYCIMIVSSVIFQKKYAKY